MFSTKKRLLSKIAALAVAFAAAGGALLTGDGMITTYADKQSELEAEQAELAQQRKDVEKAIAESEGKAEELEKYLEEYDEKMHIQEEQIANIDAQIDLCDQEIESLSQQIAEKEAEIADGVELFRERLRALYIAGNDSYASVLVGATDFYDVLARMELFERVSKHDNDMIEDLNSKIASLNADKADYEQKVTTLETKKAEEQQLYTELRETYNNHAETKAMQDALTADYNARYDEITADEARVEEELQAEIRRKQQEAERKRKEEEERRRQEEERKKQEAEANGETYVEQSTASFTSYSETGFIWPVPTVRNMSDGYGNRYIVEEGKNNFHKGIDITKPGCYGEPIVASAAGEVITAGDTGNGYGYHVVIDHGNSIATLYGHCSSLAVKVGDIVEQGQVIGYIGSTGYAYGNHCHFEVRVNGQHTEPLQYVNINN